MNENVAGASVTGLPVARPSSDRMLLQFLRFGAVGVGINAALYFGYLALTTAGAGPKSAMTLMYCAGVVAGFALNRYWTFSHQGRIRVSATRYGLVNVAGYVLQWCLLFVFVDLAEWPHAWVQGFGVITIAAANFVIQRYWVFHERRHSS